jgi:hypothetical protein
LQAGSNSARCAYTHVQGSQAKTQPLPPQTSFGRANEEPLDERIVLVAAAREPAERLTPMADICLVYPIDANGEAGGGGNSAVVLAGSGRKVSRVRLGVRIRTCEMLLCVDAFAASDRKGARSATRASS